MTSLARTLEVAHLVALSALVGSVVIDPTAPARRAPDYAGWLAGQQRVDRVMSRVAPPLFLSTAATAAAAAVVAATQGRPVSAAARTVATACVAGAIGVTLRVNEPANRTLRAWRPSDPPPDGWPRVRARWDRAHAVRRGLVAAAAAASGTAWCVDGRTRGHTPGAARGKEIHG